MSKFNDIKVFLNKIRSHIENLKVDTKPEVFLDGCYDNAPLLNIIRDEMEYFNRTHPEICVYITNGQRGFVIGYYDDLMGYFKKNDRKTKVTFYKMTTGIINNLVTIALMSVHQDRVRIVSK